MHYIKILLTNKMYEKVLVISPFFISWKHQIQTSEVPEGRNLFIYLIGFISANAE